MKRPKKGKCSNCGSSNLKFYENGTGKCLNCGRTFRWDSSKKTKEQKREQQPRAKTPPPPNKQQKTSKREPTSAKKQKATQKKESQPSKAAQTSPKKQKVTQKKESQPSKATQTSSRTKTNQTSEKQPSYTTRQTKELKGKSTGKKSKTSKRSTSSRGFMYISLVGFIVMIVSYVLLSLTMMGFDLSTDIVNIFQGLYVMLSSTGVLLIGLGLVKGAISAEDLDSKIRSWMLIAMAVLLGLFLTFNFMGITNIP